MRPICCVVNCEWNMGNWCDNVQRALNEQGPQTAPFAGNSFGADNPSSLNRWPLA
jgi:hypothetical protein